jgi:pyruvate formate lyase activating enzyme
LLKEARLKTVMVTNGYLCHKPFEKLCEVSDAMNIDLKAFNQSFYRSECAGQLDPVKRNIETAVKSGIHVELTNLVIPGLNDSEEEFKQMVSWVAALGKDIPFHISRYFPRYLETAPATSPSLISSFVEIARKELNFVYAGNVSDNQNTFCPECNELLIERSGYSTHLNFTGNSCKCGYQLPFLL